MINILTNPLFEGFKNLQLNDGILHYLKENKNIITEEQLKNNNYLFFKTPRTLKIIRNDGGVLNVVGNVYASFIITDIKTGKYKLIKKRFYYLKSYENNIENLRQSEYNALEKVLYELYNFQLKNKNKRIELDKHSMINIQFINRGFSVYELYFERKDGVIEKKKIDAGNDTQISFIAGYLMKQNSGKYFKLNLIKKIDFSKNIWENYFVKSKQRKPLKTKELNDLTRKFYKIYLATPDMPLEIVLKSLINTTSGNIRATCIELSSIMNKYGLEKISDVFDTLNKENLKMGWNPAFDTIYMETLRLAGSKLSFAETFKNLSDLIQRKVYLNNVLFKAAIGPTGIFIFIFIVSLFTVKQYQSILEMISSELNRPLPYMTQLLGGIADIVINYFLYLILFGFILYTVINYFFKYSFYGKKSIHNIMLTIPLFGEFFKRTDFEIFLSVAHQLYLGGASNEVAFPILKNTLNNYHLSGIIYTASKLFMTQNYIPGFFLEKYPLYIEPRISNLFKSPDIDPGEINTLKEQYIIDNDDFITVLKGTISSGMLFLTAAVLMATLFATVIPMLKIAGDIR